jgi:RNA polymerase sigma-70 factor (ECF subfamily)
MWQDLPPEEQDWITRAIAGDMQAFRALYDRYRGLVVAQVGRMIGPGPDVEDVAQEVFVQVHRSLARFQGESRLSTWLWRVTWHVTANWLRHHRRPVDLAQLRQLDLATDPWQQLVARDHARILNAALAELSDDAREAFLLYEIEGMTLQEIATFTNCPLHTIAARVRRSRERMAALILDAQEQGSSPRRGAAP